MPMTWIRTDFLPEHTLAAWGARAIFTNGYIDLLPDRQDTVGDRENVQEVINAINRGVLADVREFASELRDSGEIFDGSPVYTYEEHPRVTVVFQASSGGYLYIAAWLKQEVTA